MCNFNEGSQLPPLYVDLLSCPDLHFLDILSNLVKEFSYPLNNKDNIFVKGLSWRFHSFIRVEKLSHILSQCCYNIPKYAMVSWPQWLQVVMERLHGRELVHAPNMCLIPHKYVSRILATRYHPRGC